MIKNIFALVFVALIGVSSPLRAMPIQYTLSQFTGIGGSVLNGSITVDDQDMDGEVTSLEITAWDFMSTGKVDFIFSNKGVGSDLICDGDKGACFAIGANSLLIGTATPDLGFSLAFFNDPVASYSVAFEFDPNIDKNVVDFSWGAASIQDNVNINHGGQGLAVASAAKIPEPSSLALLVIALAMFFGVAARRPGTLQLSPA